MTLTADQFFQIAQGYAQAAEDPFVSPERRGAFANKAEWLNFLARRERGTLCSHTANGNSDMTGRLFAAERPKPSKRPLVTTLWLAGAAIYLIGTLLFTNGLNLFGEKDRQEARSSADRPHVISPDPPSYEATALTVPPSTGQEEGLSAPSPPPEPTEEPAAAQPFETLKVTANATFREGPSTSATKIGTAIHGAALQVKARDGNWVQFVDLASGNTGWIHSSLVRPNAGGGSTSVAAPPVNATSLAPPKPKVAKKRIKQKPSAPIQSSKQRPSRPGPPGQQVYADLPHDGVFLPPRKPGPGFLTKGRMLRKGAMSPGFRPPRP